TTPASASLLPKPIPSASTPMCSRLEYASSRFQASGRQRKGTATASDASPKPMKTCRAAGAPIAGSSAVLTRHATSTTAGSRGAGGCFNQQPGRGEIGRQRHREERRPEEEEGEVVPAAGTFGAEEAALDRHEVGR